ncbi:MAG: hypothetical protein LH660_01435 [Phormidesmis sp. CAN_BIN36]|nr:hypothetical protein [Phormidesmis sp. CAN_BIN36]
MVLTHKDASPLSVSLGQILRLPCKFIKGKSDTPQIVLKTISQEIATTGKNILPVIVRYLQEDKYQAILNNQILEAARSAKLDFVWCIVVDQQMQSQIEVELGQVLRISVITASQQELIDTLEYIRDHKPGFNKIDPQKIAGAIVEYRNTKSLTNLNFLTKAKCGIGKAKILPLSENLIVA